MPTNEAIEKLRDFFNKMVSRTNKPLSKITVMNYVSKLNKLSSLILGHPWDGNAEFLLDTKKVVDAIAKASVTGKKDYLSPVVHLLKSMNVDGKIILEYQQAMGAFKDAEYEKRKHNVATPEKAEDSMPLSEIKTKIDAYKPETDVQLMYLLICALYFQNELVPRNDLNAVKLAATTKKAKDLKPEFNYILVEKNDKPVSMVWQNYKSSHTFGSKRFNITPKVQGILKKYIKKMKKQNGDYLFAMRDGEPYKKSNFLDVIKSATEAVLGKGMGVDLIRQIQITDYYRDGLKTIAQDEKDAERYLHSSGIHKEYMRTNLTVAKEDDD